MTENIGDVMKEGRTRALKTLAFFASGLVYVGMILYSAVHNWHLLSMGVEPGYQMLAALGVFALELTALTLPIAIHFWCHAPLQRIAALGFYLADLGLVIGNVIIDYSIVSGVGGMPDWLTLYRFYVVPAVPIISGLGWALIWLLDPSARELATIETLRASTREVLAARIAESPKESDIAGLVDGAAYDMARLVVGQTLATRKNGKEKRVYASEAYSPNELEGGGK